MRVSFRISIDTLRKCNLSWRKHKQIGIYEFIGIVINFMELLNCIFVTKLLVKTHSDFLNVLIFIEIFKYKEIIA